MMRRIETTWEMYVAEFPALPFFTDAYLADTRHLTTEEHGAYLLLLMCAWRTRGCSLKDDDKILARIAGVSPTKWRRLRPVLSEFFTVDSDKWQQKKLLYVYETVAKKVARNRANGAKGGRATASRNRTAMEEPPTADKRGLQSDFTPEWPLDDLPGDAESDAKANATAMDGTNSKATKSKAKTKTISRGKRASDPADEISPVSMGFADQDNSEMSGKSPKGVNASAVASVAAAAGLDPLHLDKDTLLMWQVAGADLEQDIQPTVKHIADRQLKRTGQVPARLVYYSNAVLEARDKRLGAVSAGGAYASKHPARPPQLPFNKKDVGHWRLFLGEKRSRFRGDYLSQNWRVPRGHPEFAETTLGPDPRSAINSLIPDEIYAEYGPAWGWQARSFASSGSKT